MLTRSRPDRSCVDCGCSAPADASEYTLFSKKYGWRLTREISATGELVLEWRCPGCFAKVRSKGEGDP